MKILKKWKQYDPVAWIWLLGAYVWDIWYHVFRGEGMLDADMASEMVLADLLNREHSILGLTTKWVYSTEVKVLHMQWFYRIGLFLFPHKWHAARTVSMMLALAFLAFSVWLLFSAANLKREGIWAAALCLFPGGNWYFWQTIYGGFYLPYIYISVLSMAFILLAVSHRKTRKGKVFAALVMLLGLGSGLNGVKQLMVFYAPLLLAVLFCLCYEIRVNCKDHRLNGKITSLESFPYMVLAVCGTVFSAIGYVINSRVLINIFRFRSYEGATISGESFFWLLKQYIWSFGYFGGKVLLSVTGIASMCGVLFGLLVIFSGICVMAHCGSMSAKERLIGFGAAFSILFNVFIYSYVSGGAMQYYQLIVPMGLVLVVLEIKTEDLNWGKSRPILLNLVMAILLCASIGTVINENDEDNEWPCHSYRAEPQLHVAVDALRELGYTQGISNFWLANTITELSNGEIEMWSIANNTSDEFSAWLQKQDHIDHAPEGKFFLIARIDDGVAMEDYVMWQRNQDLQYVYSDDVYIVYGN